MGNDMWHRCHLGWLTFVGNKHDRLEMFLSKFMTVCYYQCTHTFQSESALYSCLNVKELLAQSRHVFWGLSDSHWTWAQNHLSCVPTSNHLAKLTNWLSCFLSTFCTLQLAVYPYDVTYTFQSDSALYSCLNVKELFAWARHVI